MFVISVPEWRAKLGARTYEQTVGMGRGDGYAVPQKIVSRLSPGIRMVVLDKDRGLRSEGRFDHLAKNGMTQNGRPRYDIYMKCLDPVPYKPERLLRTGVNFF